MSDSITNNATFWLSFCGIIAGILGVVLAAVNKSKCSNVTCCGLFSCTRNIEAERDLEQFKVIHGVPSTPTMSPNSI